MSRTRTKDTTLIEQASVTNRLVTELPDTGTSYFHGLTGTDEPGTEWDKSSGFFPSLVGEIGSITDQPSGRGQYNNCTHTKSVYNFPLLPVACEGFGKEIVQKWCRSYTTGSSSCGGKTMADWRSGNFPTSWDSTSNALARAVAKMEFGVQSSSLNLPTFLGELKDFKSLFSSVSNTFKLNRNKSGPSVLDSLRTILRNKKGLSLSQILGDIASADLFIQFAVKPLIRDIQSMMDLGRHLSTQRSRISGAKPVFVRATVNDEGSEVNTYGSPTSYVLNSWDSDRTYSRSITATAKISYDSGNVPQIPAAMLAMDALGFDQPISTVWELIPFSFLIDYFVQVGDWLDGFGGSHIEIPYTILYQGYSVKTVCHNVITSTFYTGYYNDKYDNVTELPTFQGEATHTSYSRVSGPLPYGSIPLPTISLPNLRQTRNVVDIALLKTILD